MNARNALTHDDYGDSAVHVGFRIRAACRDCTYDELCCFDGRDGYWDGIYFTDCGEDDAFLFPTREAAQEVMNREALIGPAPWEYWIEPVGLP